jgi:hypothetical protein
MVAGSHAVVFCSAEIRLRRTGCAQFGFGLTRFVCGAGEEQKVPVPALVQTFGINATKRSGTLRGSCGENCVPDFGRAVVLDAKLSKFELTFPDSVHQFDAGDGN